MSAQPQRAIDDNLPAASRIVRAQREHVEDLREQDRDMLEIGAFLGDGA